MPIIATELERQYQKLGLSNHGQEKQIIVREALWRLFRGAIIESYLQEEINNLKNNEITAQEFQLAVRALSEKFHDGELLDHAIKCACEEVERDGELSSLLDVLAYDAARIGLDGDLADEGSDAAEHAQDTYDLRLRELEEVFTKEFQIIMRKVSAFRETQRAEWQSETNQSVRRKGPETGIA